MAIDDCNRLLKLDPQYAQAYDQRGSQQFMLGHILESIDDFNRYLKLEPRQEPWHWSAVFLITMQASTRRDAGNSKVTKRSTIMTLRMPCGAIRAWPVAWAFPRR